VRQLQWAADAGITGSKAAVAAANAAGTRIRILIFLSNKRFDPAKTDGKARRCMNG
jgi:hypothetical protein